MIIIICLSCGYGGGYNGTVVSGGGGSGTRWCC